MFLSPAIANAQTVSRHMNEQKMNSFLTENLKEDFLITLYFNTSEGFEDAGLKRAYLDFNRTLKIKDGNKKRREEKRLISQDYLKKELLTLISSPITSQTEFDQKHKKMCLDLIDNWDELSIGQAQKWINMTLKYWLLFGEKRINNIEKNAVFFHIPIDSYVQKGMFSEKYPKAWSKIKNYKDYFEYQIKQREKVTGKAPLLDEFIFFNNYKS